MEEFLSNYKSSVLKENIKVREKDQFGNYIRYIEEINVDNQKLYWQDYFKGVETATLLPFVENTNERNKGAGEYKSIYLQIEETNTAGIKNYGQNHRITANTLMQGVLSYLLHFYTGLTNVVFGVTVSGRPENLSNVEQAVGLYINRRCIVKFKKIKV